MDCYYYYEEHELYMFERDDHQAHVWEYYTEQYMNGK